MQPMKIVGPIVNLLWLVLLQLAALGVVIELFVRFMPTALRRASQQNCYRVDGTRSDHRTYRERRAQNRLRRDMLAVLILVWLTGNALYFTVENTIAPMGNVVTRVVQRLVGSTDSSPAAMHREQVMGASQHGKLLSIDEFNSKWPWLACITLTWAVFSFGFVGWGAFRAYKSFAEGVNARSAEHFHLDMTRMSITDSQIVKELAGKNDSNQGVA